ncbi:carboxypeptidase-like regulatory domain-containing protein [Salinibacter ruber]|uniref:TonB-dependent receptor plug domain-containing protein n=1 Tax=Salinibacter ruber TaxID=146919 RepID=A0A9X2UNR8_9BACT|nr:TonB-dependent receptor [Salinibacter ruber]MCS3612107.1 hypothetical protein [Salinibacter ruber]MCS3615320.1 hypothetical protein [Salinibacter ruber]MCS3646534.1 hypothetical protein [Salinibacter ruber]MCS3674107.1 hypothetical protein [Salinibacter ruber]MCS3783970.1 hypothetical protein [Salinibacter ruber]
MSTRILVALSLLTFVVPIAEAQSTRSTVTGTVTDADGAPLPGAQIADVAFQRGTTAGPDGRYTLDGLPPGTHTLEIRFVGYQTAVREVTLQAGETREMNVSLEERVLETDGVTVTGTARARSTLRAPQDVDVMGTEDLQSGRSAALGELLQENVDGVSSIQTGAQAGKPVLRGLSGKRVVLLKDGIAQEVLPVRRAALPHHQRERGRARGGGARGQQHPLRLRRPGRGHQRHQQARPHHGRRRV